LTIKPRWLPIYGPLLARLAGSDLPIALLLGHVQVESGGRPGERTKLDERGLMQIHPATSREMGFDHSRMFDPAYSIWAGIEMFRRMADRITKEYSFLFTRGRDDFFWRIVRFEFAIGSGAFRQIVTAMQADRWLPHTWGEFRAYLAASRDRLLHATKHDPIKWATNVDRVFELGEQLARTGAYVATGAGVAAVIVAAAVGIWLWRRNQPRRHQTDLLGPLTE
jgi:hypothetical protein